jgi:hypothetical protein
MPWDREVDTPGPSGPPGSPGAGPLPLDGERGADSFVPGPPGTGTPGTPGRSVPASPLPLDGRDGQDAFPLPGPPGTSIASTVDPFIGAYAPPSFTITTEHYAIMARHLKVTGVRRVTLQGTAHLQLRGR